jgi:hypothetical protein
MLTLPKAIREEIAAEFRFAADKMVEAPDLATKSYLYSAFFGEINRVLNRSWNRELALVHSVLQTSQQTIKGRIDSAIVGGNVGLGLPAGFPEAWDKLADDFAKLFEGSDPIEEKRLLAVLSRASELAYTVTGNGYYVYLKGAIHLNEDSPTDPSNATSSGVSSRKTKSR